MSNIIKPGAGVLFMKVGTHAKEELADIIARKRAEIENVGFAMWGYGGNTCHPTSMVQPFADAFAAKRQPISLVMHRMNSRHYADQVRADTFSVDGVSWQPIPDGINVLGSKYALVIKSLRETDEVLQLASTRFARGCTLAAACGQGRQCRPVLCCLDRSVGSSGRISWRSSLASPRQRCAGPCWASIPHSPPHNLF